MRSEHGEFLPMKPSVKRELELAKQVSTWLWRFMPKPMKELHAYVKLQQQQQQQQNKNHGNSQCSS